jgi:dolichol-phosphate mannosyltransferase
MLSSIILPTYNEKGNISELISQICSTLDADRIDFEVIVVDDNSPDGTSQIVKDTFKNDSRIKLFVRNQQLGLATAIRYGIEKSSGDIVVVMDTDFNHDPQVLPQLIDFLNYYDIVIGSRFVLGGGMEDRVRYYLSAIYTIWLRFFLGIHIKDKLSGFFSIRKNKIVELGMDLIFIGYGDFFIRLLLRAQNNGYRMLEIPVFYQLRKAGHSKTNFFEVFFKYTISVIKIFFSRDRWHRKN